MKRIFAIVAAILAVAAAVAQSPEAIRESLARYPNLACPTASTYPSVPLGEIAKAPEGFEPFHFLLVGRHGSRYEQSSKKFAKTLSTFAKADSLGILTAEGKLLYKRLDAIYRAQLGYEGELADLGFEQWRGIASRAYANFKSIFDNGSIEAKSSRSMRCVMSMASFNETMKALRPQIKIWQHARNADQPIVRPITENPNVSKRSEEIHKEYMKRGAWTKERKKWDYEYDGSSFVSKVTTDREAFLKMCGAKRDFRITRYAFHMLLFGENFEMGDRELLTRLFTVDEMYGIYVYQTAQWVNNLIGVGNDMVAMRQSYVRPLIEDILASGNAAIEGKNPDTANLRFTHDSYVGPLLSIIGYEGAVAKCGDDLEAAATSFNHGMMVPMAANLQLVLYRNKRGEVLVRSLINERDATLPIKCKTAPFYPWKDFCKFVHKNMERNDKSKERVLATYDK